MPDSLLKTNSIAGTFTNKLGKESKDLVNISAHE
jgi:hypothetical protein